MNRHYRIHKRARVLCNKAGVHFIGITKYGDILLILFNEPIHHSTLSVRAENLTLENIEDKVREHRENWL